MRTVDRCVGSLGRSILYRSLAVLALSSISCIANAQTVLPADVKPTCVVSREEFQRWLLPGGNGFVVVADSFDLPTAPEPSCPFYKWSEQMFLWLVSPLPPEFHLGSHIFNSATFFTVSPPDDNNKRTLIPHSDQSLSFAGTITQLGSQRQSVVFDSAGKVHDIVRTQLGPGNKLVLRSQTNQPVEIDRIQATADGKPVLTDRMNNAVAVKTAPNGAPLLPSTSGGELALQNTTVMVNGTPRLITTTGAVVEFGQAGDNAALMGQKDALVYYLIQVNDMYAYFKTGVANAKFSPAPTQFPTDNALAKKITDFAAQAPPPHTKAQIDDAVGLAIEVKSSWVEADKVSNASDYVTVMATIPKFTLNDDKTQLTQSGTTKAKLALVGVHIVGSAPGHPEMVWATFEHVNNTPNASYTYKNSADAVVTRPADGAGPWLFSSTGALPNGPSPRMKVDTDNTANIVAVDQQKIGPSDVTRVVPWGTLATDAKFTDNNTDVISVNKSVVDLLPADDVRKNYIMIGTNYTSDGKLPTATNVAGTPTLANSTMETFLPNSNCFGCHRGNFLGSNGGGGLSHVWGPIKPLFP